MKYPDGFEPNSYPEGFEPDVRQLEVVRDEPMQFTMQAKVSLPPNLHDELRAVMDSGNPSVWWGWFHRRKVDSWTKTLSAKVRYVSTLASAYEVENRIKAQVFKNHHLMADLQAEHANHQLALEIKYTEMLLAKRLTEEASKVNLPLATYLARLDQEWQHNFAQQKTEDELATKRKDKEDNLRIEREDEHDKAIKHLDVVSKSANANAQLIISLHAQVETKLTELLAIEESKHPDHHKERLINNKKKEIERLEAQLERLEENDRKAGPRPAPEPVAKTGTDVRTVFEKVRTISTEQVRPETPGVERE